MTKSELAEKVANKMQITKAQAMIAVEAVIDSIVDIVASGHTLTIKNFGKFFSVKYDGRCFRNPRTNQAVPKGVTYRPRFKASKKLIERVGRIQAD